MNAWYPQTWQDYSCEQLPQYSSDQAYNMAVEHLNKLPPLVAIEEIERLRYYLGQAADDKAFILQGGDCAESFAECTSDNVNAKLKILLQMSLILLADLKKPIIGIGRIAGQFAKPRSLLYETQNGERLPSYQGDLINHVTFSAEARTPDPDRMLKGYHHAAYTMNYLRSLLTNGFNQIRQCQDWGLTKDSSHCKNEFWNLAAHVDHVVNMLDCLGTSNSHSHEFPFFTSHEALLLPYESALTRHHQASNHWYNCATHFPWLGMRTAQPDSPHVEYLRGIANPIAIKIGPQHTGKCVSELLDKLNPEYQRGKIMLIHRIGVNQIKQKLPELINAVKSTQHPVIWCCDPMHGNTRLTAQGIKTRYFDDIISELHIALRIHKETQIPLNGLHFEVTADNVTECIGGKSGITESDLPLAYKSLVDPRLNYQQALEIASLVGNEMREI